jgi:hypothetical protein
MDKVQKLCNSKYYTPPSGPSRGNGSLTVCLAKMRNTACCCCVVHSLFVQCKVAFSFGKECMKVTIAVIAQCCTMHVKQLAISLRTYTLTEQQNYQEISSFKRI